MKIVPLVEDLLTEFTHLKNMIEVLQIGFDNFGTENSECEASSMYIVHEYMVMLQDKYIDKIFELLNEQKELQMQ